MIHKRIYRFLAGLLSVLLLAGSGMAASHCHMQMTMGNSHAESINTSVLTQNIVSCPNTSQKLTVSNSQSGNMEICNCLIPYQYNQEARLRVKVNYEIQSSIILNKNYVVPFLRKVSVRYFLPPQSSDAKPVYLKNSVFLI